MAHDPLDEGIRTAMSTPLSRRRFLTRTAQGVAATGGVSVAAAALSRGALAASTSTSRRTTGTFDQGTVAVTWFVPPIFQYQFDGVTLQTAPDDWVRQAAAAFEADHPEITVTPEVVPWDVWAQRRAAALTQGPAPQLMYRLTPDVVTSGLIDPVDTLYTADDTADLLPAAVAAMTRVDQLFGVPWIGNPALLGVNRTLAEQTGALDLVPDGDTPRDLYWAQYLELMRKVKAAAPDAYGLGVAAGHWSAVIGWALGGWLALAGAKTWEDDTESRYVLHEQDGTYQVLDTYLTMLDEGLLVPGVPKWEDLDQLWFRNQLLSRGHWAAIDTELASAVAAGTSQPFDITYTQFPRPEGLPAGVDHNNDGNVFPIGTADAERAAAFQFAMWLARDPKASIGLAGNGFFPISLGGAAAADEAILSAKPQYQWVLKQLMPIAAIPKNVSGPTNNPDTIDAWARNSVDDLYYATWESIVTKQRPAKDAMQELGQRINRAIGAA